MVRSGAELFGVVQSDVEWFGVIWSGSEWCGVVWIVIMIAKRGRVDEVIGR